MEKKLLRNNNTGNVNKYECIMSTLPKLLNIKITLHWLICH